MRFSCSALARRTLGGIRGLHPEPRLQTGVPSWV